MSQPLHEEWKNPGAAFRGKPFWSWNGKLKKEGERASASGGRNRCLTSFVLGNNGWLTSTKSRARGSPGRIYSI